MKPMTASYPVSERLRFRLPREEDAPFFCRMMNEPDYIRFIRDHGIRTDAAAAEHIRTKTLPRFAEQGFGLWLVELKETGEPVGTCGLVMREELEYPDLGFAFLKDYRGKGFGREAGLAVLEFVQKDLKLKTLCAITDPENTRSGNLLTKIGFVTNGQRYLAAFDSISNYYIWTSGEADGGAVRT